MQINLPNDVDVVVQQKAAAAGFGEDVDAYIAHLIVNDEPVEALTPEQLKESEAMLRRGEADMEAGRVQDMREALLEIGEKRGFTLDK